MWKSKHWMQRQKRPCVFTITYMTCRYVSACICVESCRVMYVRACALFCRCVYSVSLVACACLNKLNRINLLLTPKLFSASFNHKFAWLNLHSINKCHISDGIRLHESAVFITFHVHVYQRKLRWLSHIIILYCHHIVIVIAITIIISDKPRK